MSAASTPNRLWSSTLDHFVLQSGDPARLADFYAEALQMAPVGLDDGSTVVAAAGRRIVLREGPSETVPSFVFHVGGANRVGALREEIASRGVATADARSPLLEGDAFAVDDPEGVQIVFGSARPGDEVAETLPGRLQHIVFATRDLESMERFYRERLGFILSDTVVAEDEGDAETAVFLRSDPEHHSFACFRAPEARFDHFALETTGWMDIRDWADHFAALEIPIWWGPGRHGPGNNLFFMVRDPDGNRIEISAECEIMPLEMAPRVWPHNERTLNLWGSAWMRS